MTRTKYPTALGNVTRPWNVYSSNSAFVNYFLSNHCCSLATMPYQRTQKSSPMMYVAKQPLLSNSLFCLATISGTDICSFILILIIACDNNRCITMKGHAIIGFNLDLAENPAFGPGFFLSKPLGLRPRRLTPKACPSGWVFSQAQHPMIKTYNYTL